ncbi:MAG: hypothetical protein PHO41_02200 [Eubacteriales bacterium]|nr:hypothetical protein [Eubacteriales bacterium]
MDVIAEIEALYEEYLSTMRQLDLASKSSMRAAFGSILGFGPRPANDSCNDRFSNGLQECITRFVETEPAPEDAMPVMRYVLEQGKVRQDAGTAALMLEAVHGFLVPLVVCLNPADAKTLLCWYQDAYPKKLLLPVQKKLSQALKTRAEAADTK